MTTTRWSSFREHERAFTRHYLGIDGPEGSAPLEFVDAPPRRLASALGRPEAEAGEAVRDFLAIFDRRDVVDAFSFGVGRHPPRGSGTMGYFSYLLLSCYVASVAPDVAEAGRYPQAPVAEAHRGALSSTEIRPDRLEVGSPGPVRRRTRRCVRPPSAPRRCSYSGRRWSSTSIPTGSRRWSLAYRGDCP